MERCIRIMSEGVYLKLLLLKVLNNPDDGRTLFRSGNDTDLIRMVVSLRKQLCFQRSRPDEEMV